MKKYSFDKDGFEVISQVDGLENNVKYSKDCSGARSDCCTRTCSADETFVSDEEAWTKYLDVKGGQIQY